MSTIIELQHPFCLTQSGQTARTYYPHYLCVKIFEFLSC
jgi:hypothetical protein